MSVTDDTIGAINKITYICAPNVSQRFFHESPSQFCQRNVLYHPVKIAPSRLRRYYQLLKTSLECRSDREETGVSLFGSRALQHAIQDCFDRSKSNRWGPVRHRSCKEKGTSRGSGARHNLNLKCFRNVIQIMRIP